MEVPAAASFRHFDLYDGVELKSEARPVGRAMLVFSIDAKGYAAILPTDTVPGQGTLAMMAKMKSLTASPLSGYSHE
ncbi:MAG TPA: hypothetical protein VMQ17_00095 [Candidatus Sulfotelmatobacter sp.]|nr:hypothetical protein [Candidatus Sulfotelmatobacter sp.]